MTKKKLSHNRRSVQIRSSLSKGSNRRGRRGGKSLTSIIYKTSLIIIFLWISIWLTFLNHNQSTESSSFAAHFLPFDKARGSNIYEETHGIRSPVDRSTNNDTSPEDESQKTQAPTIPTAMDSLRASLDAYGHAAQLPPCQTMEGYGYDGDESTKKTDDDDDVQKFLCLAADVREEFSTRYGGDDAARAMLQRGTTTFGFSSLRRMGGELPDVRATADRILTARELKRPFKMAFGGYSVTVGRGNYFHQSYPFVMRDILTELMGLLGVDLEVRNAAIGGVPSFPYGFCMDNFLGWDADVISWDYSMNEPNGVAEGMEAYVRHSMGMARRPMMIIKDTHMATQRQDLIKKYFDSGDLPDPVIIHTDPATSPYLSLPESLRPIGFQDWRKFGAPMGAPGQAHHHPAVKEHELIGWMIAMHFLTALEYVAKDLLTPGKEFKVKNTDEQQTTKGTSGYFLPPPLHDLDRMDNVPTSLLYGYPLDSTRWKMNPVQCRTTFEPITTGTMQEIVISGTTAEELDIMLPKGPMFYNRDWVLDLGETEKTAKRKLERYGGLGYIDVKKAYYGIYASGLLQLFLPSGIAGVIGGANGDVEDASQWFKSLIVCEVNEMTEMESCRLGHDVTFTVGGVKVENAAYIEAEGMTYLGKKLCVNVEIPVGAKMTRRRDIDEMLGKEANDGKGEQMGLKLDIAVTSPSVVLKMWHPCSVSHIVWEEVEYDLLYQANEQGGGVPNEDYISKRKSPELEAVVAGSQDRGERRDNVEKELN